MKKIYQVPSTEILFIDTHVVMNTTSMMVNKNVDDTPIQSSEDILSRRRSEWADEEEIF